MVMPWPRLRTMVPRCRPSVGFRQMTRTRLSPICCATSAVMTIVSPSSSASISTAKLISGSPSGGNSTSTTGPAIATTRPSFRPVVVGVSAVTVMFRSPTGALRVGFGAGFEQVGASRLDGVGEEVVGDELLLRPAQRLGATDDLHDLGGDGILAGAVHDAREVDDEVVRVVGGRLHRALTRRVLGCGRVEQRRERARLDVAREQEVEDGVG